MESMGITEERAMNVQSFPVGSVISSKLSTYSVGNLLQVHEFVNRLQQVLKIEEELSFEEFENELLCSWSETLASLKEDRNDLSNEVFAYGDQLASVHRALLPMLINNILQEVSEVKEIKGIVFDMLPINELTWPEVVRRYFMAHLLAGGGVRNCIKLIHCLYGEGGICCVSPTGVAAVDLDSQLLGRAVDKIFGKRNDAFKGITGTSGDTSGLDFDGGIPEWAKVLDPVRKLPTNVGSRIRNCVYEALKKNPPEWAKKQLEASISKDVYKGNASGPTKRAVIAVLDKVFEGASRPLPPPRCENNINTFIAESIMKKCRIVLRNVAAYDINKVFSNLVGRNLISKKKDMEIVFRSSSKRPVDLRTIDLRLLHGPYGGSHEAFREDVREVWINLQKTHQNNPSLVALIDEMSNDFELQYENEVATLLTRLREYDTNNKSSEEVEKEIEELVKSPEIPNVPWETGICKVCGINKDDEKVLLCDTMGCNAEYHIYCLTPPLSLIPQGDWFCPTCAPPNPITDNQPPQILQFLGKKRKISVEENQILKIAIDMEETEYWDLEVDKKTLMLKFLCEESINNNILIHDYFDLKTNKQLSKQSLRNEFLGIDSCGRLFWGFPETSSHKGIVVNEISQTSPFDHPESLEDSGKWSLFQTDEEIENLVDYLTENDPEKTSLLNSILQWKSSMVQDDEENETDSVNPENRKKSVSSKGLSTKATALLEAKYNPEPDAAESANKPRRKKRAKWHRCDCLEPVLPHRYHCVKCHRTFFTNLEFQHHKNSTCGLYSSVEKQNETDVGSDASTSKSESFSNAGKDFCVPESSLKPIVGNGREMLKQLKINLLDMEAALPDGAKRASRATPECRSAWCAFVKSANTIYEMVEATIVFETMIKTEYVKNTWWWYWSSVSVAAKTTTMSSLALRIYMLDAAIHYD